MNSHVSFTQLKNYQLLALTILTSNISSPLKKIARTVIVLSFMWQFSVFGLRQSHPKKKPGQIVHGVENAS